MSAFEKRIKELEDEVVRKKEIIASMSSLLQRTEDSYEEIKAENEALKERMDRLRSSKKKEEEEEMLSEGSEEEGEGGLACKILRFLSSSVGGASSQRPFSRAVLRAQVVNLLASLCHFDADSTLGSLVTPSHSEASNVALHYALRFFAQRQSLSADTNEKGPENYPLQWLLGMYPFRSASAQTDSVWLPLHLFLALDFESEEEEEQERYLKHLDILLDAFGEAAFAEEVSPLSIAVAKARPSLQVVRRLASFQPAALTHKDEDGCIPLMHACAHNQSGEIVSYLLSLSPGSAEREDRFGCCATHYAAFCGHPAPLLVLLDAAPQTARKVEGNGALPLHDAVQNVRGAEVQFAMTQRLLAVYPQAVLRCDDYGALPLHKAAKCADIHVFELIHSFFPQALFLADEEGLLPLHYYSQRVDKEDQLELVQFILKENPTCSLMGEKEAAKMRQQAEKTLDKKANALQAQYVHTLSTENNISGKGCNAVEVERTAEGALSRSGGRRKSCVARRTSVHGQYRR
eukprot:gene7245-8014_t